MRSWDAIVIGSGPNGLSAAIALAQAGRSVLVLEAEETIGGGARFAALTLPGFLHDVCSAVYPLAIASPFFRHFPWRNTVWMNDRPTFALAHPFDNGHAALLQKSLRVTAETLGRDGQAYIKLTQPGVTHSGGICLRRACTATNTPASPDTVTLRSTRTSISCGLSHVLVHGTLCQRILWRDGCSLDVTTRTTTQCSIWPYARRSWSLGRLAYSQGRRAANYQCPGFLFAFAGWRSARVAGLSL